MPRPAHRSGSNLGHSETNESSMSSPTGEIFVTGTNDSESISDAEGGQDTTEECNDATTVRRDKKLGTKR